MPSGLKTISRPKSFTANAKTSPVRIRAATKPNGRGGEPRYRLKPLGRARPRKDRRPPDVRGDWWLQHLHGRSEADEPGLARRGVKFSSARFASGNPGRLTTIHSASSSSRLYSCQRGRLRKLSAPTRLKSRPSGNASCERSQRLDRVVRGAVIPGCVKVGDNKARVYPAGKFHHGKPIGETRRYPLRLQRLPPHWGEKNCIQVEDICGGSSDRDMAVMWWIEGAAEEGYSHRDSLADCVCIREGGRRSPC